MRRYVADWAETRSAYFCCPEVSMATIQSGILASGDGTLLVAVVTVQPNCQCEAVSSAATNHSFLARLLCMRCSCKWATATLSSSSLGFTKLRPVVKCHSHVGACFHVIGVLCFVRLIHLRLCQQE